MNLVKIKINKLVGLNKEGKMGKLVKWFLGIFKSAWFKATLASVVDKLKDILLQVGQDALEKIKAKVAEVAVMNISSEKKAKIVFDYIKSLVPILSDSAVNYLLETLVQQHKSKDAA